MRLLDSQDVRNLAAFGTVAHQGDWVSVEEIISACVVEQDAEDVTDLGGTRFGERQVSKPGLYFDRFDLLKTVVSPVWHDPVFQIAFVATLR